MDTLTKEAIAEAMVECASTLGFCHGSLGTQPNFAIFDGIDGLIWQDCMAAYLAEYRKAIAAQVDLAESA